MSQNNKDFHSLTPVSLRLLSAHSSCKGFFGLNFVFIARALFFVDLWYVGFVATSVVDPCTFGTGTDPDPRIRTTGLRIRIRIRTAFFYSG